MESTKVHRITCTLRVDVADSALDWSLHKGSSGGPLARADTEMPEGPLANDSEHHLLGRSSRRLPPSILRAIPNAVAIDSRLSFNELTRLARRFHQDSNLNINSVTLPTIDLHGIFSGGVEAALLQLQEPEAQTVLDVFRDTLDKLPPIPRSRLGHKAAGY